MTIEELKSLLIKANECYDKGNYDEAETLASELLGKLEKISHSTDTAIVRQGDELHCEALITLSAANWKRGDLETAPSLARAALDLAEEKNITGDTYAKALGNIGNVYLLLSDYPQALTYHQKALAINEEIGSKNGMAKNLSSMGIVYVSLSDYPQALTYYQKSLAISEEIGSKNDIARNLTNIGNVYLSLSDKPQALTYYQKALAIYEEIGSKVGIASNLCNIGNVYMFLSDKPQALTYYQKALTICKELGSKDGIARNLHNIGNVYGELSDYPQALTYYQKALTIYEEIESKVGIAHNLGNIGQLYANKEFDGYDTDKAEEAFLSAIALFEDVGEKRNLYVFLKVLANLYETQKRWEEFAVQFKKYHTLYLEVQSEEATKQAQLMENRRKVEETERDRQVKLARFQEQEKILHNILPSQIADRILEGEKQIADYCENVSVFFSDIVGFTNLSQTISPNELVNMLNELFSEFDRLARKHGLEKIKTIGDAYMAVAGVPIAQEDHAERAAGFALDVIEYMKDYRKKSNSELQIRVGMHCGRAIAGVIGENKFAYDLWGDSVNTASRMESHGEAGKIHVSEDFKYALSESDFSFIERGKMEVKGKGKMKTYFLEKAI